MILHIDIAARALLRLQSYYIIITLLEREITLEDDALRLRRLLFTHTRHVAMPWPP